jgi:hypothetical protein
MNRNAKNRRFHTASRSLALTARRLARAAKAAFAVASDMGLLRRFQREEAGSFVTIAGLAMPIFIGFVGLGTEAGLWLNKHQAQQGAADSAAVSAATAYYASNSVNINLQAKAITASYNLVDGANGVTVTTNRPPKSGKYVGDSGAVEVIVQQTQERLFSALWSSQPMSISARAVALVTDGGKGCMLALDPHASKSIVITGTTVVTLNGCSLLDNSDAATALEVAGSGSLTALSVESVGGVSGSNITTTEGIETGVSPASDPYADVTMPTPPSSTCVNQPKKSTPQPNTFYCGLDFNDKDPVTLSPGTYFIGEHGLQVNGQAVLTGTDVTLVFTQSNGSYGQATINGGATVNLTAPTTGPTAGIAIFGDRNMPSNIDYAFNGGATQSFAGAIYLPQAHIHFDGGDSASSPCFQLIGRTLTFNGNSKFTINCQNMGTKPIGSATAKLVE